jgi:hypothetical protein
LFCWPFFSSGSDVVSRPESRIEAVANKGIVKAAETDRFSLRITGILTANSSLITKLSWDAPAEKSKNLQLVDGSNVGITMDLVLPSDKASKLESVLDGNTNVDWKLRIDLVLTAGSGDEKTLDFSEVSGTLNPATSAQLDMTKA